MEMVAEVNKIRYGQDFEFVAKSEIKVGRETRNFVGSLLNEMNSWRQAPRTKSSPSLRRGAERHGRGQRTGPAQV